MRKKITALLPALICVLALTGCQCNHEWDEANCQTPKTCRICQQTEGTVLGHDWQAATCQEPMTCAVCGLAQGEPLSHSWEDATCASPRRCSYCGLTSGEALSEHTWQDATTETPKTCAVCGITEGERIITDARFTTDNNRALFGCWQGSMTLSGTDLSLEGYVDQVACTVTLCFGPDGSLDLMLDFQDKEAFLAQLYQGTQEQIYQQLDQLGLSREESDQVFADRYGQTLEEYAPTVWEGVDWDAMIAAHCAEYVYYAEDYLIFTARSWQDTFAENGCILSGESLTIPNAYIAAGQTLELTRSDGPTP